MWWCKRAIFANIIFAEKERGKVFVNHINITDTAPQRHAGYYTSRLTNGLRIALLPTRSKVVYCGFAIWSGSRNDPHHLPGLAHFVEHMLFKGTTKRRPWHILNRMERVGGELNAYTSKEDTFVYTSAPRAELVRSVELLADLLAHSTFPQREIERERIVVADEINLYKDTPSEQIYDDFEELLLQGHPLAHGILGHRDSLALMGTQECEAYAQSAFTAENMVFFCMGQVGEQRFCEVAERYLGQVWPRQGAQSERGGTPIFTPFCKRVPTATHQAHALLGGQAPSMHAPERVESSVLMNILAGLSMNTRLNLLLREQRGWVYTVESTYTSLPDTGWWQIYFGTDPCHAEQALAVTYKELERMRTQLLSSVALKGWVKQLKGQLALSSEQSESTFLSFGRQMLHRGSYTTVSEAMERLDAITLQSLHATAEQLLHPSNISLLLYQGQEAPNVE